MTTAYEVRISDWSSDVCSSDLSTSSATSSQRRWCRRASTISRRALPPPAERPYSSRVARMRAARSDRGAGRAGAALGRSEEHTSELQSLMRISYAVFCLKKKKKHQAKDKHKKTEHKN